MPGPVLFVHRLALTPALWRAFLTAPAVVSPLVRIVAKCGDLLDGLNLALAEWVRRAWRRRCVAAAVAAICCPHRRPGLRYSQLVGCHSHLRRWSGRGRHRRRTRQTSLLPCPYWRAHKATTHLQQDVFNAGTGLRRGTDIRAHPRASGALRAPGSGRAARLVQTRQNLLHGRI